MARARREAADPDSQPPPSPPPSPAFLPADQYCQPTLPNSWRWAGSFEMYAGPQNDEFLPVALAGVHPGSAQLGDEVAGGGTEITDIHVFAMWFSISRFSSDYGFQQSAMIPWRAVEGVDKDTGEFDGSRGWYEPRPMNVYSTYGPDGAGKEDDGSTIWADWMSCCSPMYLCTEMFYSWVLANGVLGFAALALASLTLLFQLMMVDFAVNNNFLANIPATSLWSDWWEDDSQFMVKIFWPFGQMMAYTQVIGAVYDTTGMNQTGSGPFLKYQLKSLARRYEGQTYAYPMICYWAVFTEITTVVFISYFSLFQPIGMMELNTGNPAGDLGAVMMMYGVMSGIPGGMLAAVWWAGCLTGGTKNMTVAYFMAPRVGRTTTILAIATHTYLMFWTYGQFFLWHTFPISSLWLWSVPISMVYFGILWNSIPYLSDGPATCFAHGSGALIALGICTTLAAMVIYIARYGCFMFPCLCAPDVPGWVFFPPSPDLSNPAVAGVWDHKLLCLFLERAAELLWDPAAALSRECLWEPEEAEYRGFTMEGRTYVTSFPLDTSAYPRGMHTGVGMANDIGQKLAELEAVVL